MRDATRMYNGVGGSAYQAGYHSSLAWNQGDEQGKDHSNAFTRSAARAADMHEKVSGYHGKADKAATAAGFIAEPDPVINDMVDSFAQSQNMEASESNIVFYEKLDNDSFLGKAREHALATQRASANIGAKLEVGGNIVGACDGLGKSLESYKAGDKRKAALYGTSAMSKAVSACNSLRKKLPGSMSPLGAGAKKINPVTGIIGAYAELGLKYCNYRARSAQTNVHTEKVSSLRRAIAALSAIIESAHATGQFELRTLNNNFKSVFQTNFRDITLADALQLLHILKGAESVETFWAEEEDGEIESLRTEVLGEAVQTALKTAALILTITGCAATAGICTLGVTALSLGCTAREKYKKWNATKADQQRYARALQDHTITMRAADYAMFHVKKEWYISWNKYDRNEHYDLAQQSWGRRRVATMFRNAYNRKTSTHPRDRKMEFSEYMWGTSREVKTTILNSPFYDLKYLSAITEDWPLHLPENMSA